MAEKQTKDRQRLAKGQRPKADVTIHTADELEELLLASVRAGTFPAKFFPSWSARMQIEVGKAVREGRVQKPAVQAKPVQKASAKPQEKKPERKVESKDLPYVQAGLAKFFRLWNESSLPKLSFEKDQFLQAYRDGNLTELLSRTIVGRKPADVDQQVYRLAVADFMKEKLGFKPHKTEKVIGKDEKGKPKFELDGDGKPVLVDSKFDLAMDVRDGQPASKALLSLSEEEYQASQQWFPGVRASLRKLSGQNQVRSQPKPTDDGKQKSSAGGGAKKSSKKDEAALSDFSFMKALKWGEDEESSTTQFSDEGFFDCTGRELTERIQKFLVEKYPRKGYDKVNLDDKNIQMYENLTPGPRMLQSSEVKKFLEMEERVGTICCCLFIHSPTDVGSKLTAKMAEYYNSGELKKILVTPLGIEILQDLEEQFIDSKHSKAGSASKK